MPKAVGLHGAVAAVNKELGPRLKTRAHHRILLQGGGNQLWQHEQYPQCKRMAFSYPREKLSTSLNKKPR